jgi:hypothetical protein
MQTQTAVKTPLLYPLSYGGDAPLPDRCSKPGASLGALAPFARGTMGPLQTLEKLIDKCRLLPQTLLFSGFNDGTGLDSLYGLSVPLEQLPQFGADVGSFLLGHPSEYAHPHQPDHGSASTQQEQPVFAKQSSGRADLAEWVGQTWLSASISCTWRPCPSRRTNPCVNMFDVSPAESGLRRRSQFSGRCAAWTAATATRRSIRSS